MQENDCSKGFVENAATGGIPPADRNTARGFGRAIGSFAPYFRLLASRATGEAADVLRALAVSLEMWQEQIDLLTVEVTVSEWPEGDEGRYDG